MPRFLKVAIAGLTATLMFGCGSGTANDQKAMEAKYNQGEYEKAMIAAGRGAELEEQKRLEAERKAQGDR